MKSKTKFFSLPIEGRFQSCLNHFINLNRCIKPYIRLDVFDLCIYAAVKKHTGVNIY